MSRRSESTEFLKECMADAALRLLQEKPLEKISVQEITELAGVSRITYFRHFEHKGQLLEYKLTSLWKRHAKNEHLSGEERFNPRNAVSFFRFNLENKDLLLLLYKHGLSLVLLGAFNQVLNSRLQGEPTYEIEFYEYGLFGILNAWILNDFKETPEEMAEICMQIVKKNRERN